MHYTSEDMRNLILTNPAARVRAISVVLALEPAVRNKYHAERRLYSGGPSARIYQKNARFHSMKWLRRFNEQIQAGRTLSEKQHKALCNALWLYTDILADIANGKEKNPLK